MRRNVISSWFFKINPSSDYYYYYNWWTGLNWNLRSSQRVVQWHPGALLQFSYSFIFHPYPVRLCFMWIGAMWATCAIYVLVYLLLLYCVWVKILRFSVARPRLVCLPPPRLSLQILHHLLFNLPCSSSAPSCLSFPFFLLVSLKLGSLPDRLCAPLSAPLINPDRTFIISCSP